MSGSQEIITDEEIERVHANADFGSMKKRGVVVKTYTDRVIEKLISSDGHHKKVGCWYEGKFYVAWADQSKSRMGVKYNRLIRLRVRLGKRIKLQRMLCFS